MLTKVNDLALLRQEVIERLSWSRSEIIDQDGNVHKASQLFDRAIKAKHNDVKLFTSDRAEDLYVEILAAVMGEGTLVRGPVMPEKLPEGRWHWISHTSGSTGKPKWVGHTFETLIQPALAFAKVHELTNKDRFFNFMPLISENFTFGMMANILSDTTITINKFNPFTTTKALVENNPTVTIVPPGPYTILRRGKDWTDAEFPNLRMCLTGSNFVVPGYFEDMRAKGATPFNGFGCTEVPGNCTAYPHPDYLGKEWYPGCDYKIEEGCLHLRWQGMEYWNTGDLVEFDEVHGVKIVGRVDNQFKYLDNKVQPEPIEMLAKQHFNINEAMVKLENDSVVMYYEGSADPIEIRKLLEQHFAIVPRKIQAVEQLPRNPLGKLIRK
jgi:acyl-coenzyme A synthetase/AMP-(fatty) acid ligase